MPTTQTEKGLDIITPLVHLNGSSAESLSDGYRAAWDAVQAAVLATAATAPNARDYYMQSKTGGIDGTGGFDAFKQARAEHHRRMEALTSVLEQLVLLAENVMKQQDTRVSQ